MSRWASASKLVEGSQSDERLRSVEEAALQWESVSAWEQEPKLASGQGAA